MAVFTNRPTVLPQVSALPVPIAVTPADYASSAKYATELGMKRQEMDLRKKQAELQNEIQRKTLVMQGERMQMEKDKFTESQKQSKFDNTIARYDFANKVGDDMDFGLTGVAKELMDERKVALGLDSASIWKSVGADEGMENIAEGYGTLMQDPDVQDAIREKNKYDQAVLSTTTDRADFSVEERLKEQEAIDIYDETGKMPEDYSKSMGEYASLDGETKKAQLRDTDFDYNLAVETRDAAVQTANLKPELIQAQIDASKSKAAGDAAGAAGTPQTYAESIGFVHKGNVYNNQGESINDAARVFNEYAALGIFLPKADIYDTRAEIDANEEARADKNSRIFDKTQDVLNTELGAKDPENVTQYLENNKEILDVNFGDGSTFKISDFQENEGQVSPIYSGTRLVVNADGSKDIHTEVTLYTNLNNTKANELLEDNPGITVSEETAYKANKRAGTRAFRVEDNNGKERMVKVLKGTIIKPWKDVVQLSNPIANLEKKLYAKLEEKQFTNTENYLDLVSQTESQETSIPIGRGALEIVATSDGKYNLLLVDEDKNVIEGEGALTQYGISKEEAAAVLLTSLKRYGGGKDYSEIIGSFGEKKTLVE